MPAISLAASANFLDCGSAPYCGILVLERGDGPGNYNHAVPSVHGLWPQDKEYGTSQCVPILFGPKNYKMGDNDIFVRPTKRE
jgi:hypothetical protein